MEVWVINENKLTLFCLKQFAAKIVLKYYQ